MPRRRLATYAILASSLALVIGCSGSAEKKLLQDFFRSSRLRDNVTLGNFATATFDPRTDGVVSSFDVLSISDDKTAPLPLKQYAKAVDDAKAADADFQQKKRTYQNENLAAIQRVIRAEDTGKPVAAKDKGVQEAWDKLVSEADEHTKAVSDAMRQLSDSRGIAELSLSRPNGATVDATQFEGVMVSKEITINATIKTPDGQTETKKLLCVMQRPQMKDESGKDLIGRWIITSVKPA
jgi:hypothetical protein